MTDNDNNESWVEKYRPTSFDSIQGNNKSLRQLKSWAENWEPGDEAQLLVGPPGVGKTTTAQVISDTLEMPMTEINASTARKTEDVVDIAADAQSTPADADHQLVLIDEVDGWPTGRGAPSKEPMYDVLDDPPNPIILTANDAYQTPDGVTNRVNQHDFKLGKRSRKAKLKDIIESEGVEVDDRDLQKLAARPDLRSAINDLQILVEQDVPLGDDGRQWDEDAFDAIPEMLSGNKYAGMNLDPEDLVMWLDQAVAKEYRGLEAGVAYDCLSRADKWLGRTRDTRNYRYWKYAGSLARMVPEVRLTDAHSGYIPDLFPEWFRHSVAKASSDKPVSRVYRKLKNTDGTRYEFSGSFVYFRKVLLPILQDLDEEERREIALEHRLEGAELDILNLDEKEYEEWSGGKDSSVEEYGAKSQSVLDF
ncbi:replication factor C large subunit [Haloarcula virus HCTV-16]|nr:replication factor C large subunit [Haloarcula virus HCTV-16]